MLKRITRNALCIVAFFSGIFHLARFLSDTIQKTAVILCFHRVVEGEPDDYSYCGTQVDLSRFERQITVLSRLFTIVPFSVLVNQIKRKTLPHHCLALTFDDGFRDSYTNVFAVLKEHGIPALFFVSPIMIESFRLSWQHELWYLLNHPKQIDCLVWEGRQWDLASEPEREKLHALIRKILFEGSQRDRETMLAELRSELGSGHTSSDVKQLILSATDIAEMRSSGLAEFGSHAMTHAPLSTCTEEELEQEIRQSKSHLERIANQGISSFAYPFGNYSNIVIASVKKTGYAAAVTLDEGLVKGRDDLFSLKRISVVRDDTVFTILIRKIFPFYLENIINHIKETFYGD